MGGIHIRVEAAEYDQRFLPLVIPCLEFAEDLFEELGLLGADTDTAAVGRGNCAVSHLSEPQQLDQSIIGRHYPSVELRDQLVSQFAIRLHRGRLQVAIPVHV
jgi:hypothetical protein